jgi:hypothetical protein
MARLKSCHSKTARLAESRKFVTFKTARLAASRKLAPFKIEIHAISSRVADSKSTEKQPQILRLRSPQNARQTPLRMTDQIFNQLQNDDRSVIQSTPELR